MNVTPIQNFVLIRFQNKVEAGIILPEGQRAPDHDIIVEKVGPDVPENTGIKPGVQVLLRGDSKIFDIDGKRQTACIPYQTIMATVEESLALPTDAQIDAIAGQS